MIRELATISKASLEIKDRSILNFIIHVDYENGFSQGLGQITLDDYNKVLKKRIGTAYGCEMIRELLITLDVNDFSEMKGKNIFVLGEGEGLNFKPKGIQQLRIDGGKKMLFDEIFEQMKSIK